ncbi:hypothetical protein HanIR_Chr11g0558841 [Helianthus annuus]|nr:hypothetical protein HanIR_Chr11g0558841 [Helianthus annuus]
MSCQQYSADRDLWRGATGGGWGRSRGVRPPIGYKVCYKMILSIKTYH